MLKFKEAFDISEQRSAAWHADGGANDEGHKGSKFREVHKVYINGRHWKTFNDHGEAKKAHDSVKKKYPDKSVSMHRTYMESIDMCNVCGQTLCNCTHMQLEESLYTSKIEGGSGKGKEFGHSKTTVDDHLSAMKYHHAEYQKAVKEKRTEDANHHGKRYYKHKEQIEALGTIGNHHKEETEMGDAAHAKTMKHRVLVTYSDPHHSASSMRKEKVQKHLLVPSTNKNGESVYKAEAEELAKKHMKKQGYKVHEVEHVGLVSKKIHEEVEQIDELSSELLARYKEKAGLAAQAADKAKKYDIGHKRFKGILKATFKQFANDAKK